MIIKIKKVLLMMISFMKEDKIIKVGCLQKYFLFGNLLFNNYGVFNNERQH